jgi:hypothetical protein
MASSTSVSAFLRIGIDRKGKGYQRGKKAEQN